MKIGFEMNVKKQKLIEINILDWAMNHLIVIVNILFSFMLNFEPFNNSDDRYNDNDESNSTKKNDLDGYWKSTNSSRDNIR